MTTGGAHNKIVFAAARDVLRPLGLVRKGRSRTWLDDHGWWVTVVVFESSGFSAGSGLEVAADFLWHDRDYLAYAVPSGVRVNFARFAEFEEEADFAAEVKRLAIRAAEEVQSFRARFQGIADWAEALDSIARSGGFWRMFDAGIACALVGEAARARYWFDSFQAVDDDRAFAVAAQARARAIADLIDKPAGVASFVARNVSVFRQTLKLPTLPDVELMADLSSATPPR